MRLGFCLAQVRKIRLISGVVGSERRGSGRIVGGSETIPAPCSSSSDGRRFPWPGSRLLERKLSHCRIHPTRLHRERVYAVLFTRLLNFVITRTSSKLHLCQKALPH